MYSYAVKAVSRTQPKFQPKSMATLSHAFRNFCTLNDSEEPKAASTNAQNGVKGDDAEILMAEDNGLKESVLRTLAEEKNVRKIAKSDVDDVSVAKAMLDVADDLKRVLHVVPVDQRENGEKCKHALSHFGTTNGTDGPHVRQSLDAMSHDKVYVLDANLVIGYKERTIPGWNEFADKHVALGKKFYMVPFNYNEIEGGCPDWCEALITDQPITLAGMDSFYKKVINKFDVKGNMRVKLKTDIMSIGVAGFAVASAPEHQISIESIKSDNVIYLTHNLKVLKRLLGGDDKIKVFEKLVDESGLEHLIALRGVYNDGTFKDYW